MSVISDELRRELRDPEYSEGYAESFLNSYIATQTKVIREQRGLTQAGLAEIMGTTQTAVSRIENVNYSAWNIRTLKKIARALRVRLKVSFETYGSLPDEVMSFSQANLERASREEDAGLWREAPAHEIRAAFASTAGSGELVEGAISLIKRWAAARRTTTGLIPDQVAKLNQASPEEELTGAASSSTSTATPMGNTPAKLILIDASGTNRTETSPGTVIERVAPRPRYIRVPQNARTQNKRQFRKRIRASMRKRYA